MSLDPKPQQYRRPLTDDELATIRQRIIVAADTQSLLSDAVLAVYAALLSDSGHTIADLPAGQRLNPADYAIPANQGQAIVAAITHRAQAWGTAAQVALDLVDVMPSFYPDPHTPAPDFALRDYRPEVYHLQISRDGLDVIAACEAHLHHLQSSYGRVGPDYLQALHSWHRALAGLFSLTGGIATTLSKDGQKSLLVRSSTGLAYSVTWHGVIRRCTDPACAAVIDDSGVATPGHRDAAVLDHTHSPSYRVGVAQPGQWSLHS